MSFPRMRKWLLPMALKQAVTTNNGINFDVSDASAENEVDMTSTELIPSAGEMENGKSSKKKKKVKKDSDGSNKKKKKNVDISVNSDDEMFIANGFDSVNEPAKNENLTNFNESVVSNLRMQFEKVAAEVGLDKDGSSSLDSPEVPITFISKKRKRARNVDGKKKKKQSDFAVWRKRMQVQRLMKRVPRKLDSQSITT